MESKEKVISLYKYIKELCALKYRVTFNIEKQHWKYFLKDIPNDPTNINIFYRDQVEDEPGDDTILLKVKKPEFQRCPEPPTVLEGWLELGWDRFTNNIKVRETLLDISSETANIRHEELEHFKDSEQRIIFLSKWESQRNDWAMKQQKISLTRNFFAQLFQIYTDLQRESDTLEIMVGNGIIKASHNNEINHPILLKRVKLQFDAKLNIMSIHDTDTEPELYTLLLQEIPDINHAAVKQIKEDLNDNFFHPLDRNETPDFLKILTHNLCSDSRFIADEKDEFNMGDKLITSFNPVFFVRKRIDGSLKAIEEIINNIENTGYIPGHLLDLVGGGLVDISEDNYEPSIEDHLASLNGESLQILLSKEANREQLEIAERIEHYNAVLVQGPPGTGKTHTIANLLGHFLAQGKSVLVTSHTKKALAVLKEKIPDDIKNLCVSVLDDTNIDMVRSVDGISEYMSRHTSNELRKRVETGSRQRAEIISQLGDVRKRIYNIKYQEFEPIVYNGDNYSPSKIAAFVNANTEELSYIPGKVKIYHPMPVNVEQLIKLYRSNASLTELEELELCCDIPSPNELITPAVFAEGLRKTTECQNSIYNIKSALGLDIKVDLNIATVFNNGDETFPLVQRPLSENLKQLSHYISSFKGIDGWMIHAAIDGRKGGGYAKRWEMLIEAIENAANSADIIITQIVGRTIVVKPEILTKQLSITLKKLTELFQKRGKVIKLDLIFNKQLEAVFEGISINGIPIASEADCQLVQNYLTLQEKRNSLSLLWNELMAKHGEPDFFALGYEPELIGLRMVPNIKRYLDWYKNEYAQLLFLVEHAGLNKNLIFFETPLDSDLTQTERILNAAHKDLPLYIEIAKLLIILCDFEQLKNMTICTLTEGARKNSDVCNSLVCSINDGDEEKYSLHYQKLSELYTKYSLKASREETLSIIEPIAPEWADAIKNRMGIHGEVICPQNIEDAWKWKQFVGIIDSITAEPFEELQRKAFELGNELRKITAKVAANSAWYHLLLRTERNLDMKQALQGWKLTVKKIGKGTGKNAPILRRRARELMSKCQTSVPAWIMTANKAMESLDPARNTFDVIIIDEASQSDVSALGIVYMAKKIIIVGDDQQVSPMAVGVEIDKMNAMRDMYISDIIPNSHLYDAKTSIYDIAKTTFPALMLREHFRCLPDIIGYSNKLSYDFKIKPLRDAGNSQISPPVVKFRVEDGKREGKQKTNVKEAETIVALMMACMEQKEYDNMTFGAISLLGDEQAQKMQQFLLKRFDPTVIEQRRLLCGNASHFQGDERDVIFISLVDSNEGDGPLSKSGEGSDQSRKQRFNVAASRAKDQLWVVHSLDYKKDLKSGDLRRDLLEYADNPKAFAQLAEKVEANSESPFEDAVGKTLVASGYHIVQQWEVGAYRIDMVVIYNDKSIAIECDGDAYHNGDEKIRADMERQAILERIGWRFIRIRGSEYYRDPHNSMQRVYQELSDYGIQPETTHNDSTEQLSTDLLDCVKIRAAQILDAWHEDITVEMTDFCKPLIDKTNTVGKPVNPTKNSSQPFEQLKFISTSHQDIKPKAVNPQKLKSSIKEQKIPPAETKQPPKTISAPVVKPKVLNTDALSRELEDMGLEYIDNRKKGGALWIFGGMEHQELVKRYKNYGVIFTFTKNGGKATGGKDGWWTKHS